MLLKQIIATFLALVVCYGAVNTVNNLLLFNNPSDFKKTICVTTDLTVGTILIVFIDKNLFFATLL